MRHGHKTTRVIIVTALLLTLMTWFAADYCYYSPHSHSPEECQCFFCQGFASTALSSEFHLLYLCIEKIALDEMMLLSLHPSEIYHPPLV